MRFIIFFPRAIEIKLMNLIGLLQRARFPLLCFVTIQNTLFAKGKSPLSPACPGRFKCFQNKDNVTLKLKIELPLGARIGHKKEQKITEGKIIYAETQSIFHFADLKPES